MPGVAGEGAAAGARIQAQALRGAGTGFNFLRPGFANRINFSTCSAPFDRVKGPR